MQYVPQATPMLMVLVPLMEPLGLRDAAPGEAMLLWGREGGVWGEPRLYCHPLLLCAFRGGHETNFAANYLSMLQS